jgi:O-acetyl-ADP-ribose deacetylase (regulator of RNase III)
MKKQFGKTWIELVKGDITELQVDAVVNAANSQLNHGGGVAGVIVKKGGALIQQESELWVKARGPLPVGWAAITSGGRLPARYVIHAVGPRMGEGNEDEKLKRATTACLETADRHNLKTIGFPAISTGIFGYPIDRCAKTMLSAVLAYIRNATMIERVVFCLYGKEPYKVFEKEFKILIK